MTINEEEKKKLQEQTPGYQATPYQESDAVKQAQAMLQQQISKKPGEYQSQWQPQLNDMVDQILNREQFSYDLNKDALYNQLKDQYVMQGQKAMMDTMGQAQAMTGGYGNSFAQSVGQQAYQGYLQQLNDRVPDLYQLALSQYQMEGDAMADKFALLAQQEDQDYGRYRDDVSDWRTELERLYNQFNSERDYDYGKWADGRDFGYGQYIDDRNYQYQQDRDKISDEQWQKEFDENMRRYNQEWAASQAKASRSSGGGGGNPTPKPKDLVVEDTGFTGSTYSEAVAYMKSQGVDSAAASGIMTASEWSRGKNSGSANNTAKQFTSYNEYLQYTVDKKIATK